LFRAHAEGGQAGRGAGQVVRVVGADPQLEQPPDRCRRQPQLPAGVGGAEPAVVSRGEPEVGFPVSPVQCQPRDSMRPYPEGYSMTAVNVDSEELADVIRRLRRAQGQIGGVIRMIEEGQECSDVLTQLAAAARALDRAGFKIIANGLCQCVLDEQAGREEAAAERDRLERLFLALA
jgi:DNA-binding FrmR family transcriptional regulator